MQPGLRELYDTHSGKVADKWESYLNYYEFIFAPRREAPINLLEIGVQNGGSLEIWAKYFQNARNILGADVDPKVASLNFGDARIRAVICNATKSEAVEALGGDALALDVVIDDGSHYSCDVIKSFLLFFPTLAENGLYIVEDVHCSYFVEYGGALFEPTSSMAFFKRLADVINREHWDNATSPQHVISSLLVMHGITDVSLDWIGNVHAITFTNSLVVIEKAPAGENRLGRRVLSGNSDLVAPADRRHAGIAYDRSWFSDPTSHPPHPPLFAETPEERMELLEQELCSSSARRAHLEAELERRENLLHQLQDALQQKTLELTALRDSESAALDAIRLSTSWRITAPLRAAKLLFHRKAKQILGPKLVNAAKAALREHFGGVSFDRWLKLEERCLKSDEAEIARHIRAMVDRPSFAVIVDIREGIAGLSETVSSIREQLYEVRRTIVLKTRLNNAQMQINVDTTSSADVNFFKTIDCEYVILLSPGDRLQRDAVYKIASAINRENQQIDIVYFDEDRVDPGTFRARRQPFYKPDWSPDYLESCNYIGRAAAYRRNAIVERQAPFEHLYDFALRLTEGEPRIVHLSEVLLIVADQPNLASHAHQENMNALKARLERTGRQGMISIASARDSIYRAEQCQDAGPLITAVIPTAGKVVEVAGRKIDLIENVVESLRTRTSYNNLEIIVVDNNDLSAHQLSLLDRYECKRLSYLGDKFNVALKLNMGVAQAKGEFALLLNDDIEPIHPDWLNRMLDQAAKPGVGVVGALLLYPNGRVQHAGVVYNHGLPDHVNRETDPKERGYFGCLWSVRNYLGVTGACMLTPTSLYRSVGGYSEILAVSFNDVDYCMKVLNQGPRIVSTPFANLTHMESMSRIPSLDMAELGYFTSKWAAQVTRDPFFNERVLRSLPPYYEPRINRRIL